MNSPVFKVPSHVYESASSFFAGVRLHYREGRTVGRQRLKHKRIEGGQLQPAALQASSVGTLTGEDKRSPQIDVSPSVVTSESITADISSIVEQLRAQPGDTLLQKHLALVTSEYVRALDSGETPSHLYALQALADAIEINPESRTLSVISFVGRKTKDVFRDSPRSEYACLSAYIEFICGQKLYTESDFTDLDGTESLTDYQQGLINRMMRNHQVRARVDQLMKTAEGKYMFHGLA